MRALLADNVAMLRQAERLLRRLSDAGYRQRFDLLYGGSIGAQLRHVLDHYDSFLDGLPRGEIDYADRQRNQGTEEVRLSGIVEVQRVCAGLERVGGMSDDRPLRVRSVGMDRATWMDTTSARELEFLASHGIHHLAMIGVMCGLQGVSIEPGFGVAPSTLRWWRQDAGPAVRA